MKILVLSRYSNMGASSRFRMMQYFDYLKAQGQDIECQELFSDEYIGALYKKESRGMLVIKSYIRRGLFLLRRPKCDVVWIEKELFPWIPYFIEKMFLKWLGRPYILDYDDAVFHNYDLHRRSFIRSSLGNKHPQLIKRARAVIAGNQYLANTALKFGCEATVEIPTVVSGEKYAMKNKSVSKLVIGWIGSPSTVKYLDGLNDVLASLSEEFDIEFHIVGAVVNWAGVNVKHIQWSEESEVDSIQAFDIGIMPLQDSPWERGKCGFKLIQYMACGKAVVASDIGCNSEIVVEGETGLLVNSTSDWLIALRKLITNSHLRESFGIAGRDRFERLYSLEKNRSRILGVLQKASYEKV